MRRFRDSRYGVFDFLRELKCNQLVFFAVPVDCIFTIAKRIWVKLNRLYHDRLPPLGIVGALGTMEP